jgi:hypothetical protein
MIAMTMIVQPIIIHRKVFLVLFDRLTPARTAA